MARAADPDDPEGIFALEIHIPPATSRLTRTTRPERPHRLGNTASLGASDNPQRAWKFEHWIVVAIASVAFFVGGIITNVASARSATASVVVAQSQAADAREDLALATARIDALQEQVEREASRKASYRDRAAQMRDLVTASFADGHLDSVMAGLAHLSVPNELLEDEQGPVQRWFYQAITRLIQEAGTTPEQGGTDASPTNDS